MTQLSIEREDSFHTIATKMLLIKLKIYFFQTTLASIVMIRTCGHVNVPWWGTYIVKFKGCCSLVLPHAVVIFPCSYEMFATTDILLVMTISGATPTILSAILSAIYFIKMTGLGKLWHPPVSNRTTLSGKQLQA